MLNDLSKGELVAKILSCRCDLTPEVLLLMADIYSKGSRLTSKNVLVLFCLNATGGRKLPFEKNTYSKYRRMTADAYYSGTYEKKRDIEKAGLVVRREHNTDGEPYRLMTKAEFLTT